MAKSRVKASKNKAKNVEQKPVIAKPITIYEIPEPLLQMVVNYIANSTPRNMTVQEAVSLTSTLQRLKVKDDKDEAK